MQQVIVDPESKSLRERFALIRTPRKSRNRFAEACVEIVASEKAARQSCDEAHKLYPAVVYGPSASSESVRIYYLVRWL